jgi:hypothetical protein
MVIHVIVSGDQTFCIRWDCIFTAVWVPAIKPQKGCRNGSIIHGETLNKVKEKHVLHRMEVLSKRLTSKYKNV